MSGALLAALLALPAASEPLFPRGYSHNDYRRARPLDEALDAGFNAVEADVHLRGGELLVGHGGGELDPARTLDALYLRPLAARARANGGSVHPGGPKGFLLMVEFKSDAAASYAALRAALAPYHDVLTRWQGEAERRGAVSVVITGKRPLDLLPHEPVRWAALDGGEKELDHPSLALFPTASLRWEGPERVPGDVRRARAHARRLRYWGAPDKPANWRRQRDAGVDLLGTDKPAELRRALAPGLPELLERLLPGGR